MDDLDAERSRADEAVSALPLQNCACVQMDSR